MKKNNEAREVFGEVYFVYDKDDEMIEDFDTLPEAKSYVDNHDDGVYVNKVILREDDKGETETYDVEEKVYVKAVTEGLIKEDVVSVSRFIQEKAEALADYLGVDKEEIRYHQYGESDFFVAPDGDEYLVCDNDEATRLAREDVIRSIDEMGITSFTPEFQDWAYSNAVDVDWFEEALKEQYEFYVEDIESEEDYKYANRLISEMVDAGVLSDDEIDEDDGNVVADVDMDEKKAEFVDYLVERAGDPVEAFKSDFGDAEFNRVVSENGLLDYEAIADEAIDWDGRGHFLSSWDSEERELDGDFFAYKQNEGADYDSYDEIDYTVEEALTDSSTDYTKTFCDMLDLMEFRVVKEDDGYHLDDLQGANLGGIESEAFDTATQMLDRMDAYLVDYILDPIEDGVEECDIDVPEDVYTFEEWAEWLDKNKDDEKVADLIKEYSFEVQVLDMVANHPDAVDLAKVYDYYKDVDECLTEDTVKRDGKWANVGKDGKADSGKFKTKKEADAQRKAMFANGYKGESLRKKKTIEKSTVSESISEEQIEKIKNLKEGETVEISVAPDAFGFDTIVVGLNEKHPEFYHIWSENSKTGEIANEVKYSTLDNIIYWANREREELDEATYVDMWGNWENDSEPTPLYAYKLTNAMTGDVFLIYSKDKDGLKKRKKEVVDDIMFSENEDIAHKYSRGIIGIASSDPAFDFNSYEIDDETGALTIDGQQVTVIGKESVRF